MRSRPLTDTAAKPGPVAAGDVAIVLVIGALGILLALQGWRSRLLDNFWAPAMEGAEALLRHGQLPDRGTITSFYSYSPPGFAWIVLPGVALSADPRLLAVPANAILHLATLMGVFLLARACFGTRIAWLSTLLYGFSANGLMFAASYEPRGHPITYVWMAYWTCMWVARNNAWYLAAALVTWLTGMYVFLEVAPAVFMLPAAWIVYRPSVRFRALAAAGVIGFVMWFPYLRFEAARDFADIRSQVLLENVQVENEAAIWCDASHSMYRWMGSSAAVLVPAAEVPRTNDPAGMATRFGRKVLAIARGLEFNFEGPIPGAGLLLLALTASGLLVLSLPRHPVPSEERAPGTHLGSPQGWVMALAIGMLVCGGLASEIAIGYALGSSPGPLVREALPILQAIAVLSGLALLMRRFIARSFGTLALQFTPSSCDPRVLVMALVVPWTVLLLVSEWQRHDRFVALWPLQVIVLVFFVTAVSARMGSGVRPTAYWVVPLLIIVLMQANPYLSLSSRFDSWRRDGWSGGDAVEVRVADYLAKLIRAAGKDRAAIGYRLFVDGPPEPPWAAVDPRLRDGERFDLILRYRHKIANLNPCGEGVSAQDEYRIVDRYPASDSAGYFFDVPPTGRFLDQIGNYDVYKRD